MGLSPTAFAASLVGVSEVLLAYISYSYSKYPMLRDLKYFAYGLIMLAIKEVACGALCPDAPTHLSLGAFLEAFGLSLIVYSVAKILKLNIKYIIALVATLALFSAISLLVLPKGTILASILFTFFMPFLLFLLFIKDYVISRDKNLLFTSVSFLLYSFSFVLEAFLTSIRLEVLAINLSLLIKLTAIVTLMIAFFK